MVTRIVRYNGELIQLPAPAIATPTYHYMYDAIAMVMKNMMHKVPIPT
jgi:hypothetical protein